MLQGTIRVAGIVTDSVVDGPGVRYVVFTQGCYHNCRGCQNPQTHDPSGGYDVSLEEIYQAVVQSRLYKGVTFSGGEPFLQWEQLLPLAKKIREAGKDVVCFTGYYLEQIKQLPCQAFLPEIDILIDGPFVEELKTLDMVYRGSSNQRMIKNPSSDNPVFL